MAKILTTESISRNNIENYIKNATSDYSKFLNDTPVFVTYYSKDLYSSSFDKSFETTYQVVGSESPNKFNKIEKFPIYKTETSSFGTEITDFGINSNITSSAIIIPDTISPVVDDLFLLYYNNATRLFIVTDVDLDNYNNKKYYKITFKLSTHNVESIELQVNKNLIVDFNRIGKTINPVHDKVFYDIYKKLEVIYDKLLEYYNDTYYDKFTLIYTTNFPEEFNMILTAKIIDNAVNKFMMENSLTTSFQRYRDFKYINVNNIGLISYSDYKKTIYGRIVHNDNISSIASSIKLTTLNKKTRLSLVYLKGISLFESVGNYDLDFIPNNINEYLIELYDIAFYESLSNNTSHENVYLNFIIKYCNDYYNEDNYELLLEHINHIEFNYSNYYTIPLCLYIIKFYIRKMSSNIIK
jgi:hypothetical protein